MAEPIFDNLKGLINTSQRPCLINSPATDFRSPWFRWQQPAGLIKVGTYLQSRGYDVRLIDCIQIPANNRLTCEKVRQVEIEGYHIDLWCFGLSPLKVIFRLREWEKQDWKPDIAIVSCGMSFWWQGAKELISQRKSDIKIPIILGGPYPTYYSEHAALESGADALFVGDVSEASNVVPDWNIYAPGPLPRFAGIHLLNPSGILTPSASPRDPRELAGEVEEKVLQGVTTFAFFDALVKPEHRQHLVDTLKEVIARKIPKIHFIAPGNFSPRLIDPNLATLLKEAGFNHIYLHDDIQHSPNQIDYLLNLDDYRNCIESLSQAGFHPRTDEIGAAIVIGIPGEDLDNITSRLVQL